MEFPTPIILLCSTTNLFLLCCKDNLSDRCNNHNFQPFHIREYDAQRDDNELENIIIQCEDELETNWYTCKKYRFTTERQTHVAQCGQKVIGFVCYDIDYDRRFGHIELLGISHQYRNHGYGRKLLQHALHMLKVNGMEQITIHVPTKNRIACSLYKSEGFEFSGRYASTGTILPILVKRFE